MGISQLQPGFILAEVFLNFHSLAEMEYIMDN
jgi:hypothetical protein